MALTELIERRTRFTKTWDTGVVRDGRRVFRHQIGGCHHHGPPGQMVETDCNWHDLTDRFGVGAYPFDIDFNKQSRTLRIVCPNGDVLTLQPRNAMVPTSVSRSGQSVTLTRLWTGINLTLTLSPEGLKADYRKTATNAVNPSWNVTGPVETYMRAPWYEGADGEPVHIPLLVESGAVTLDVSSVPTGAVVDPTFIVAESNDNAKIVDASLSGTNTANNYGIYAAFRANTNASGTYRALIRFPSIATDIPAGSTIDNVKITLFPNHTESTDTVIQEFNRVIAGAWAEGEHDGTAATAGEVSWGHRVYNTVTWNTTGCRGSGTDFNADVSLTRTGTWTTDQATDIPGTAAGVADVQGWLDGTLSNYGWVYSARVGTNKFRYAYSSEYATAGLRPSLTIEYTEGGGSTVELAGEGEVTGSVDAALGVIRDLTAAGAMTLSADAALQVARLVAAEGLAAVTGDAALNRIVLLATEGGVALNGDMALLVSRLLTAEGSSAVSGDAAALIGRILAGEGASALAGDAALDVYNALASEGSVTIVGDAQAVTERLLASEGVMTLTGGAAMQVSRLLAAEGLASVEADAGTLSWFYKGQRVIVAMYGSTPVSDWIFGGDA